MQRYPLHLSETRDFLLDIMPKAGHILRRYFHADTLEKTSKGGIDFVTNADLAVDEYLRKQLRTAYPGITVLTEETAPKDYSAMLTDDPMWVVDPLDGTANFARGDDNFSICVALVWKRQPILGVVFAPISSRMFWAQDNKNAAFWNGRRISVSTVDALKEATVCTDWSHMLETRDTTTHFLRKVYGHVRQIKILGSAATDLTLLARGGVDVYYHVKLHPWDVAASSIIAKKAGAIITDTEGKPWNAFTPDILAADPKLHAKVLRLISS